MRITPFIVEEIKRTIPDAIALDPLINITRMRRHLEEQFNRSFSFYYTRKLMHKVAMQSRMEADRTQIEQRNEFYPDAASTVEVHRGTRSAVRAAPSRVLAIAAVGLAIALSISMLIG